MVSQAVGNQSIVDFVSGGSSIEETHGQKHCLIFDEVDGMSGNQDRGGMQVSTVKDFKTHKMFAVITLKFKQRGLSTEKCMKEPLICAIAFCICKKTTFLVMWVLYSRMPDKFAVNSLQFIEETQSSISDSVDFDKTAPLKGLILACFDYPDLSVNNHTIITVNLLKLGLMNMQIT